MYKILLFLNAPKQVNNFKYLLYILLQDLYNKNNLIKLISIIKDKFEYITKKNEQRFERQNLYKNQKR